MSMELLIKLAAETKGLRDDMETAVRAVGGATDRIGGMVDKLRTGFMGLAGAYIGVQTVREFIQTADAMAAMEGRLKNVVGTGAEFTAAQKQMVDISLRNNVAIADSTALFTRIYEPITKMGGGVREVSTMVDALSTGLRLSNATQAESSSAITQFSQAMASGALRGEEFNSVNEAAPEFLGALANSLGVGRGELRKMAEDGKLTADVVGNAMPTALAELSAKAAGLPETVGGAMTDLTNEASLAAASFDKTTGTTAKLAEGIGLVADLVREFSRVMGDTSGQANAAGSSFDVVGGAIRVVGTIAETVLVTMSEVTFVLKEIGRTAGGVAAMAVAAARLDFDAVGSIRKEMIGDSKLARDELDRYQAGVLGMTNRVLNARDALKTHTVSVSENTAELRRLGRQGTDTWTQLQAQANSTKEATKQAAGKKEEAAAKNVVYTAEEIRQAQEIAKHRGAMHSAEQKAIADYFAAQEAAGRADEARRSKEVAAANDALQKAKDEFAQYGLTRSQIAELGLARLEDKQKAFTVGSANFESVQKEIDAQKALIGVLKKGEVRDASVQAAKDSAAEWQKTTDSIGQGLTDSLFRAFESGKGFFSTFWAGIKNLFKTTVLQLAVKPVQQAISGAVGSLLGMPAQAAGGGSGLLSGLGGLGNFGGGLSAGLGALTGEAGFGGAMSAAGTAFGAGNIGGAAGTAMGALGPYVAAAAALSALYQSIKHKPTPHMGSVVGIGADGAASTMYGDSSQILNNYSADTDAALRGLGGVAAGGLNDLSRSFGGQGGYAAMLKFAADGKDASIGSFGLNQGGAQVSEFGITSDYNKYSSDREAAMKAFTADVASATRDAVDGINLPEWARAQFDKLGDAATIEQFAATVAAVTQLQAGMEALRESMTPMGGVFGQVAALSGDALAELIGFSGGIEAFTDKVRGFTADYYTQAEQASIQANEILTALKTAGIDASGLSDRASFRALVEDQGNSIGSTEGRAQLAALLDVSKSFATLADYLSKEGLTLGEAAKQSPGTLIDEIDPALETAEETVKAVDAVADGIAASNETLATIAKTGTAAAASAATTAAATADLVTATEDANVALVERIASLQATMAALMARVADTSQQTAEQLRRWDSGDAMNTRTVA